MLQKAAQTNPKAIRQGQAYTTIGGIGPGAGLLLDHFMMLNLEGEVLVAFCSMCGLALQWLAPDIAERVRAEK